MLGRESTAAEACRSDIGSGSGTAAVLARARDSPLRLRYRPVPPWHLVAYRRKVPIPAYVREMISHFVFFPAHVFQV